MLYTGQFQATASPSDLFCFAPFRAKNILTTVKCTSEPWHEAAPITHEINCGDKMREPLDLLV